MSIIKGAAHHHICSNRLHDVVAGAAHHYICRNKNAPSPIAAEPQNICSTTYPTVSQSGRAAKRISKMKKIAQIPISRGSAATKRFYVWQFYKYCAALPLNDWQFISSPLNTEGYERINKSGRAA